MSTADYRVPQIGNEVSVPLGLPQTTPPALRLSAVRRREGMSQSTMARRLGISLGEVKSQEEANDLPLSTIYQWQEILQVPLMELLAEIDEPLSSPVMARAKLVRLMKTARAIQQRTRQQSVGRLAEVLVGQLLDLMPELEDVTPWPEVGQPRTLNELGQVVHRRLADDVLTRLADTA